MEKQKTIRILQMNSGSVDFGGVSAFIMSVFRHIDRSKYQFDFLSPDLTTYENVRGEIENNGGKIYELHCGNGRLKRVLLFFRLYRFLRKNPYDIVHINSGSPGFNLVSMYAAHAAGIRRVIIHSHNAIPVKKGKKLVYQFCYKQFKKYAEVRLACSNAAGRYMFGTQSDYTVINNGIELERFRFSEEIRERVRNIILKEHGDYAGEGREDIKVYGHVGRMAEQKNPLFLIDVFASLHRSDPDAVLWMIGDGPLRNRVEQRIRKYKLQKNVMLLGFRNDVNNLMMGMDALIFPSLHEGLSIVTVEAQASGLQVFASDTISKEHKISDYLEFIPLSYTPEQWADSILSSMDKRIQTDRNRRTIYPGYSIEDTAENIQRVYSSLLNAGRL